MLIGKRADAHFASAVARHQYLAVTADARLRNEDAQTLHEVAPIAQRLKADDVVLKQRMQQRHAPGQLHEKVERGKRDVQEEADAPFHAQRAQVGADVHQMIVVHPDEVGVRSMLGDPRGILGIDFPIAAPINRIEVAQRLQIVEQRPDDAVGEAEVEVVHLLRIQADRFQRIARRSARSLGCQLDLLVGFGRAGPADPHTPAVAQHRKQSRHQPT